MYWIEILTCVFVLFLGSMNCAMKERKKQNSVVIEVGDILLARVSIYFIFMVRTAWLTNHLLVQLNLDILNIVIIIMYFISMSQLSWKFQPLFVLILKAILNPWIFSSIFMVIKFEITYEIFFKTVFASCKDFVHFVHCLDFCSLRLREKHSVMAVPHFVRTSHMPSICWGQNREKTINWPTF